MDCGLKFLLLFFFGDVVFVTFFLFLFFAVRRPARDNRDLESSARVTVR
ncbi:p6 [Blackcurrant-associated closterovirus 1]|uniref:P6 n=1 Tax=Blackcurrant closterovirus 1 TaxID=2734344 RepID=A0A385L377_9CLOS|nr:p6 [Blackcurrant-associated closterovirus 1]AYA22225.1 p6 [Blackcurrant-associated closterovirus 1]